jgi:thiamine transport system permease protein
LIFSLFVFGLAFPYGVLLVKIGNLKIGNFAELFWALKNTAIQSVGAALLSLMVGFALSFGIPPLASRWRPWMTAGLFFPFFVPSLYIIALWMAHVSWMGVGNFIVMIAQGLIASGYVAVRLREVFESKLASYAIVAETLGSDRKLFFRKALGVVRPEMISLFFFVFVVTATSFAVPLVLGGSEGSNLEILIYEKIRISFAWEEALSISLVQLAVILLFSFLQKKYSGTPAGQQKHHSFFFVPWSQIPLLAYLGFFVAGFFWGLPGGIESVQRLPGVFPLFFESLGRSLLLGTGFALLVVLLLSAAVLQLKVKFFHQFLQGFVAPSTALIGFAFLFFPTSSDSLVFTKYLVAFFCLVFGSLYRWGIQNMIHDLNRQTLVAETLGAGSRTIFLRIVFPQVIDKIVLVSCVGGFWFVGDFALAKLIVGKEVLASLVVENLISSYRTEAGLILGLVMLVMAGGWFYLLKVLLSLSFQRILSRER